MVRDGPYHVKSDGRGICMWFRLGVAPHAEASPAQPLDDPPVRRLSGSLPTGARHARRPSSERPGATLPPVGRLYMRVG